MAGAVRSPSPIECKVPEKQRKVEQGLTREAVVAGIASAALQPSDRITSPFLISIQGDGISLPTEAEILKRTGQREEALLKEIEKQAVRKYGKNERTSQPESALKLNINLPPLRRRVGRAVSPEFSDDPASRVASRVFERRSRCGPPPLHGSFAPFRSSFFDAGASTVFGGFGFHCADVAAPEKSPTEVWKQMLKSDNGPICYRELDGKEELEHEAILDMVIEPIVQSEDACITYLISDETARTQFINWMPLILESFGIIKDGKNESILKGCLTLDDLTNLNEIFHIKKNQIYMSKILNICMKLGFQNLAVSLFCIIAASVVLKNELIENWAGLVGIPNDQNWKEAFFFWSDHRLLTDDNDSDLENILPLKDVAYNENKKVISSYWKELIDSLPDVEEDSKQIFALFLKTTKVVAAMEELLPYLMDVLGDNFAEENIIYICKLLMFLTLSGKTDKASELLAAMKGKAATSPNMIAAMELAVYKAQLILQTS